MLEIPNYIEKIANALGSYPSSDGSHVDVDGKRIWVTFWAPPAGKRAKSWSFILGILGDGAYPDTRVPADKLSQEFVVEYIKFMDSRRATILMDFDPSIDMDAYIKSAARYGIKVKKINYDEVEIAGDPFNIKNFLDDTEINTYDILDAYFSSTGRL